MSPAGARGARAAGPRWVRLGVAATVVAAALAVGTPPAGAGSGSSAGTERKVPAKIASDCSVDVTEGLNRFVARSKRGSTVVLAEDGCYRVEGSLKLVGRKDFTLDGNGATIESRTPAGQGRRHVWVWGGRDLVIRDLTVRGANPNAGAQRSAYNPTKAFQHGFALQGVKGAVLDRVAVYDVYGDFVYVGPDLETGAWSRDVEITRSTFEGSGRQGISVVAGKHVEIDRNRVGGTGLSLFDLEANRGEQGAVDVRITRNSTGAVRHFWLANKGAGLEIRNIVVKGNETIEPAAGLVFVYGPTTGYRGPFRFVDNYFAITGQIQDEGSKGAFFFSRARDVTITGNTVTLPGGRNMPAVENRDSENIVIEGNTFRNAGQELIVTTRPGAAPTTAP